MSDGREAIEQLRQDAPDAVIRSDSYGGQHWADVPLERLVEVCRSLRDAGYDFLVDVTAIHWPDEPQPMELVYHLYSYERNDRVRIKTRAAEGQAVPTLTGLWNSAAWNERETYDMFGIRFEGHPDLRRILMPDDYTDFPLRKELPLYRG